MRNKEMLHRIKIAGEYQRKAIRALFPGEMSGHLDVIEKEIILMVKEAAEGLRKDGSKDDRKDCEKEDDGREKQSHKQTSKVKKVDIT